MMAIQLYITLQVPPWLLQYQMLSTLKFTTSTPIGKEELRKIKNIWQSLQDNHDSAQFRQPVDWQGLKLFDYPEIVKNPMDLNTINNKLQQEKYVTVEEVFDDIQLIWDNCKTYNLHGSWIYDLADKLQKSFKKMARNNFSAITLNGIPQKNANTSKATQQIKHEDKLKFVERIKVLRPQQLGLVVAKIQQLCPAAYRDGQGEKAQIVIDCIDIQSWKKVIAALQSVEQPQDVVSKKMKI